MMIYDSFMSFSYIYYLSSFFKDALNDGHAIVANLGDIYSGNGHSVLIYAVENKNLKIKDSHGVKYEIPIDRPDFYQVINSDHSL